MMALFLALLLNAQGQEQEFVGPPRPPMYRWKDRAGQMHVTTTVPPPNATILEILIHNSAAGETSDAPEEEDAFHITPEEFRNQMESALGQGTINYWRGIDKSLYDARLTGNTEESIKTVDAALNGALWGDKLWAVSLLPVVVVAICLLLAWWLCAGLSKPLRALIWIAFGLAGLFLSHVGLQSILYRAQARRLDFMLSMMPYYLGGHVEMSHDDKQAIRHHAEELSKAANPLSPAWAFPGEVFQARQTLRRVVLESELVPEPEPVPDPMSESVSESEPELESKSESKPESEQ